MFHVFESHARIPACLFDAKTDDSPNASGIVPFSDLFWLLQSAPHNAAFYVHDKVKLARSNNLLKPGSVNNENVLEILMCCLIPQIVRRSLGIRRMNDFGQVIARGNQANYYS